MGKLVGKGVACPICHSADNRRMYEDGSSYCWSPNCPQPYLDKNFQLPSSPKLSKEKSISTPNSNHVSLAEVSEFRSRGFIDRGVTREICEFFGVKVSMDANNNIACHYYPYQNANKGISYKQRVVATKEFFWVGPSGDLFGIEKFQSGGKRLIITEGEIDALSVAQALMDKYKQIYPVISLTSATGTDKLLTHREWIRSFEEVVLWMDADDAGATALEKAQRIIGVDKVKIVKSPEGCKDANDVLRTLGSKFVMQSVWDAVPWTPAGIIQKDALWDALVNYNALPSIPYPACIDGLNSKVKGMRLGEIVLFISGTGSGKSTLIREIELSLLSAPLVEDQPDASEKEKALMLSRNDKIGIISLEEAPAETARKLSGMALNRNPANEEIPLEILKMGFDQVFGSDRVILLDHQGSISDGSILEQLEYMALMGCKYLFIDHITILVSEGAEGLTGNEAIDKVMNDLLRLAKRHNVWIGLVSHLRKSHDAKKTFEQGYLPTLDDIKGSGSIKQICFDIVGFARDMTSDDEIERNTIKMVVLKSRYTGLTGSVPGAFYNHTTGRLTSVKDAAIEKFEILD